MESVVSELWGELKRYINVVDRVEAAEILVQILMDNDCDADEIKQAFKSDSEIKRALAGYLDQDKDYEQEEEANDEDDFNYNDDYE